MLDAIAAEGDEPTVVKVNVEQEPGLASRYGISGIPVILRLERGEVVAASVGAAGKARLENALGLSPTLEASEDRGGLHGLWRLLSRSS